MNIQDLNFPTYHKTFTILCVTNTSLDNISFVYSEYIEYVITNYKVNLVCLSLMAVIFSGLSNYEQRKSGTSGVG